MKKEDVIKHFKGVKNLASALDIWPQAIYQWPEIVPKSVQYKIQVITDGKFKVEQNNK